MDPDSGALLQFYRDLIWGLDEHARKGRTAIGAAAVAKRIARGYLGDAVEPVPLPRWNRAELADRAWKRASSAPEETEEGSGGSQAEDLERLRALLQARDDIERAIDEGVATLAADGASRTALARVLGVHRATLYRRYDVGGDGA